jgi:hypothetical protein
MKLATFTTGGAPELGVVSGDSVIALRRAAPGLPTTMIELIAAWPTVEAEVRRIAAAGQDALALDKVRLLAPVPWQDLRHRSQLCRPYRRERRGDPRPADMVHQGGHRRHRPVRSGADSEGRADGRL